MEMNSTSQTKNYFLKFKPIRRSLAHKQYLCEILKYFITTEQKNPVEVRNRHGSCYNYRYTKL